MKVGDIYAISDGDGWKLVEIVKYRNVIGYWLNNRFTKFTALPKDAQLVSDIWETTWRPNCYKCIHIQAQSKTACEHPDTKDLRSNQRDSTYPNSLDAYLLDANIARHSYCWPNRFNPSWLLRCNGYSQESSPEAKRKPGRPRKNPN